LDLRGLLLRRGEAKGDRRVERGEQEWKGRQVRRGEGREKEGKGTGGREG